jgi:hypothetical protein
VTSRDGLTCGPSYADSTGASIVVDYVDTPSMNAWDSYGERTAEVLLFSQVRGKIRILEPAFARPARGQEPSLAFPQVSDHSGSWSLTGYQAGYLAGRALRSLRAPGDWERDAA